MYPFDWLSKKTFFLYSINLLGGWFTAWLIDWLIDLGPPWRDTDYNGFNGWIPA